MTIQTEFEERAVEALNKTRDMLLSELQGVFVSEVRRWQLQYPRRKLEFIMGMGTLFLDVLPREGAMSGSYKRYRVGFEDVHADLATVSDERLLQHLRPLVEIVGWAYDQCLAISRDLPDITFEPLQ